MDNIKTHKIYAKKGYSMSAIKDLIQGLLDSPRFDPALQREALAELNAESGRLIKAYGNFNKNKLKEIENVRSSVRDILSKNKNAKDKLNQYYKLIIDIQNNPPKSDEGSAKKANAVAQRKIPKNQGKKEATPPAPQPMDANPPSSPPAPIVPDEQVEEEEKFDFDFKDELAT